MLKSPYQLTIFSSDWKYIGNLGVQGYKEERKQKWIKRRSHCL